MSRRQGAQLGQISDFDLRLIRVFKAVVDSGGFTAAEAVLGISRSAISIHMGDLEARTGLKLCQRGRSGFALTEEGREVYRAGLQLLAAMETFRTEVNALHRHLRGELNIGITDNLVSLPHMRITHALAALKEAGPEVRINIHMVPPSEVEVGVMDGHLHVGVVPAIAPLAGLDYRPLYGETVQLYCGEAHPLFQRDDAGISDDELAAADAVVPSFALPPDGQRCHEPLQGTATATDREGIAFLVLTGRYIGFLPEHFAARWVTEERLRALRPDEWHYQVDYSTITRRGRRPHLVLETFLDALYARPPARRGMPAED